MMKTAKIFAIILLALVIESCKCPSCGSREETSVPSNIIRKGDEFIISKTGKDYFNQYIKPDLYSTRTDGKYYHLVYRINIPGKPDVNGLPIRLSIDSTGNIDQSVMVSGIPEVLKSPEEGQFNISKEQAESIAVKNNLPKGVKEWSTGLVWSDKFSQWVWHVISTENETITGDVARSNGKEVIIDPASGLVLELNDWQIK